MYFFPFFRRLHFLGFFFPLLSQQFRSQLDPFSSVYEARGEREEETTYVSDVDFGSLDTQFVCSSIRDQCFLLFPLLISTYQDSEEVTWGTYIFSQSLQYSREIETNLPIIRSQFEGFLKVF